MTRTVKQVSKLCGLSVRTLHYYDQIGLLKPTTKSDSNYRLYDETSLVRLQEILLLKELGFSLQEISKILDNPNYNRIAALKQQKELLKLKRNRLDKIISMLEKQLKGETNMNIEAFGQEKIEETKNRYAQEVKERWGNTAAYEEFSQREQHRTKREQDRIIAEETEIFKSLARQTNHSPASLNVQALIAAWQEHITKNYYHCNKQTLACLGKMYTQDTRFVDFFNQIQTGLADFISKAISIYCKGQD